MVSQLSKACVLLTVYLRKGREPLMWPCHNIILNTPQGPVVTGCNAPLPWRERIVGVLKDDIFPLRTPQPYLTPSPTPSPLSL